MRLGALWVELAGGLIRTHCLFGEACAVLWWGIVLNRVQREVIGRLHQCTKLLGLVIRRAPKRGLLFDAQALRLLLSVYVGSAENDGAREEQSFEDRHRGQSLARHRSQGTFKDCLLDYGCTSSYQTWVLVPL